MKDFGGYQAMAEEALGTALQELGRIPDNILQAMSYSLEAGGKRLRPVLLLAACDLMGGSLDEALPFACAVEMIHTYSLIHDDLPAMDNDDLRRGKPSNHKVFGEGMALLAGDGLLSAAMETMLRASIRMDTLRGAKAAEAIARRCGVCGMVAGQALDIGSEEGRRTAEQVRELHLRKTADLITAPLEAGFLLAAAKESELAAVREYGQALGLAFQMVDDLLDVTGDPALLGKKTGVDAELGKQNWVALRGIEGAREDARAEAERAKRAIGTLNKDVGFFTDLADSLLTRTH